ncbi:MAG TPA: nodulation protein NfeD [Syntrophales bacterium]|nr:nodulation protein NfeD [Syntrophales bacterium]HRV42357.1 nodulation protein NfeD [Syntrophales bacterium]
MIGKGVTSLPGLILLLLGLWGFIAPPAVPAAPPPVFNKITVSGAITPPMAEFILANIEEASREGRAGLIILLDTPGGLDLAMRDIAKGILNAPLPVIVFVYPAGARAASAGVIVTVAAHVAAMAPGTNIGAAHPVAIGFGGGDKTMMEKVENDAAAYVRGIARQRGRSEEWVERAVRKSESVTAEEALKKGVIDLVAADVPELLRGIDGREVKVGGKTVVIKTQGAVVTEKKMGTRQRVLTAISDPNVAYILFLLGLAGLYFEFSHPGVILPGVVGAISLILAFFAMQTLPINYAGILLIVLGVILFIAEMKVVSHGILTVGGIISLVVGSLMLFESPDPALRVSLDVMIPSLVIITLFFVAVIVLVVRAQLRRKRTGREGMVDAEGVAVTDVDPVGKVLVKGEYWQATSVRPIKAGMPVRVISVDGLRLQVEARERDRG